MHMYTIGLNALLPVLRLQWNAAGPLNLLYAVRMSISIIIIIN